jgi:hypothetical protein
MRVQRFSEFGELPYYLERLRFLGVQFTSLLLVLVLTGTSVLLLERLDLTASLGQTLHKSWRGVLFAALGPPRIGVQIGHDGVSQHPDELHHLRGNTGGLANGLSELSVNRAVAAALERALEAQGVTVDILRATPPAGYRADLMLALHADSVWDSSRTGYKSAISDPPRSWLEAKLKNSIDTAYLEATGLGDDSANTTENMRDYYAFNFRLYEHSVHPATPALIVELGYLSNPYDAALLRQPERLAEALASGIVPFLQARNRLP